MIRVSDASTRHWIIEVESSNLAKLHQQLEASISHYDYRDDVPWADEVGSWKRALRKLSG
jgi:hypothetical protein